MWWLTDEIILTEWSEVVDLRTGTRDRNIFRSCDLILLRWLRPSARDKVIAVM